MSDYGMFTKEQLYASTGMRKSKSLFIEYRVEGIEPIFTLSRHEREGLISLRNLYIQYCVDDPTEVEFAEAVFGDYGFWLNLSTTMYVAKELEEWRAIVDIKRKAQAFKTIMKEVQEDGRAAFSAAKYLIEEPWKGRKQATRQKVKETATKAYSEVQDDINRLRENGLLQ